MLMSTLNIYLFIRSCILSTKTYLAPGPESGMMGAGAAEMKTQFFLQDLTVLRRHGKMCCCNSILSFWGYEKSIFHCQATYSGTWGVVREGSLIKGEGRPHPHPMGKA